MAASGFSCSKNGNRLLHRRRDDALTPHAPQQHAHGVARRGFLAEDQYLTLRNCRPISIDTYWGSEASTRGFMIDGRRQDMALGAARNRGKTAFWQGKDLRNNRISVQHAAVGGYLAGGPYAGGVYPGRVGPCGVFRFSF